MPQNVYINDILNDARGVKLFYNTYVSAIAYSVKSIQKWSRDLHINNDEKWWLKQYQNGMTCSKDTKLLWFQFRLCHRIIGTNSFLFNIGVSPSPACSFCGESPESILHVFVECQFTRVFWQEFAQIFFAHETLSPVTIIFGIAYEHSALNLILVLAKYHIYNQKLLKSKPSFQIFMLSLKKYYALEKYIYNKNGHLDIFTSRWDNLVSFIL